MEDGEKQVVLTITGSQKDHDGSSQESSSRYEAVCRESEEGRTYFYQAEEGPARLHVTRSAVTMERGGAGGTRMVFDPSVPETSCLYKTPYGAIPMEIRTERLAVLFGSCGRLRFRLEYQLAMEPGVRLFCRVTAAAD